MASKYDTNPLDPDFPEKARAAAERGTTGLGDGEKRAFPHTAPATEQETRRFGPADVPYAPFDPDLASGTYHAPVGFVETNTLSRKVPSVGLPENVMTAVPYIPWYLGLVAGLLILFFVPRSESKVRFHAAQGLAAHIAILIISSILGVVSEFTDFANIGNGIFNLVTMVVLLVFAYKAWKGRPVHIESIDDLTNWLDEKISPRNQETPPGPFGS